MNSIKNDSEPGRDDVWPPFRVLCVDDNRDCAESAAMLLKVSGFDSRFCFDGETALLLNDSFRPAICFIDLNMPGMNGYELASRLRTTVGWKPMLLIAVTAMSDEANRIRVTAAFDMHLIKPVAPEKLVQVVNLLFRIADSSETPAVCRSAVADDGWKLL